MLVTLFRRAASAARTLALCGAGLLGAAAAAAAPGPAGAVQGAQASVRELAIADYRSYLAEDHPVRQGMRRFAELVEAGSGGRLRVVLRADALPGTPAQQIAALQAGAPGAPALMLVAATGLAPLAPDFALLDLPYLVQDHAQADALLDGVFGDALLAQLAQLGQARGAGLVGLAWWENGFRQITSTGAPIRSADALRGLRMRVIDAPVFVDTARAMGAEPVPLAFADVHDALRSGRVAAQDNFISQILAGGLHELQASLSITNHSYGALVLVANRGAWRGLDPAHQALVAGAAREAGRFQRDAARAQARQAMAQLARSGMDIHELAPTERDKLRARTAPLRSSRLAQHSPALWKLYQAHPSAR
ncbi:DctP family TRAP transporter solute-binding subunit [Massilia sp. X63]|uniref:DctP family TRAP transporter solute-binding subunit n=1 Tax=Massilia sp. X63 TaxID=3237285 RepID=UPI0034DD168B